MRTGFDTIGNATLIAYDNHEPIIATDPWIQADAYFGSWGLSHEIPKEQFKAVVNSKFIWFSHGHPDHLNGKCLRLFKGKTILLPDHVGGRIKTDLEKMGFTCSVLPDRQWVRLSENVRVLCIADYNQDGVLLVDINGRLAVNLNDANDHGWGSFVKKEIKKFKTSILLALFGFGDADMINFYEESGKFIEPWAARREPVGKAVSNAVKHWGTTHIIPFSSLHTYQRADSVWANKYATRGEDYIVGYDAPKTQLLPPFLRYDCETDTWHQLNPKENEEKSLPPEDFKDNWTDVLDEKDFTRLREYFLGIEHFHGFLDFVTFKVGGKDYTIDFKKRGFKKGITFETPRGSLMIAAKLQIFDDLLIGNFTKTTLHGDWHNGLYPDFTPYIGKYADNGLARSNEELRAYFDEYRKRQPLEYLLHGLEKKSHDYVRKSLHTLRKSPVIYSVTRAVYRKIKK